MIEKKDMFIVLFFISTPFIMYTLRNNFYLVILFISIYSLICAWYGTDAYDKYRTANSSSWNKV